MSVSVKTFSVCTDADWHSLAIVPEPSDYFIQHQWSSVNISHYAAQSKAWLPSVVFALTAFISLGAYAGWLIFRRCKASWGFKADKHDTTARAQSKVGRILQVLVVAIAVVALGLTICAMAQIRKGAVQEGVQRIDGVAVFTTGMAQRTTLLSKRLADTFAQLPQVDQTLATVKRSAGTLPPAVETAMTTLSQVASQAGAVLQTAAHSVQQAAWDITAQVSEPIRQEQADLQGAISAPETAYYYAMMVVLGLALGVITFVPVASVFAHRTCLSVGIVTLHVFAVLYFVGTIAAALAVGGANDVCPSVEDVVLHQLQDTRWAAFGDYYLNTANKATLADTLKKSDIVDLETVNAQLILVDSTIKNAALTNASNGNVALRNLLANINNAIEGTTVARDSLLAFGDARVVRPLYLQIKAYGCCEVPNNMANVYKALTSAGWMVLALAWMSWVLHAYLTHSSNQTNTELPTVLLNPPATVSSAGLKAKAALQQDTQLIEAGVVAAIHPKRQTSRPLWADGDAYAIPMLAPGSRSESKQESPHVSPPVSAQDASRGVVQATQAGMGAAQGPGSNQARLVSTPTWADDAVYVTPASEGSLNQPQSQGHGHVQVQEQGSGLRRAQITCTPAWADDAVCAPAPAVWQSGRLVMPGSEDDVTFIPTPPQLAQQPQQPRLPQPAPAIDTQRMYTPFAAHAAMGMPVYYPVLPTAAERAQRGATKGGRKGRGGHFTIPVWEDMTVVLPPPGNNSSSRA